MRLKHFKVDLIAYYPRKLIIADRRQQYSMTQPYPSPHKRNVSMLSGL